MCIAHASKIGFGALPMKLVMPCYEPIVHILAVRVYCVWAVSMLHEQYASIDFCPRDGLSWPW